MAAKRNKYAAELALGVYCGRLRYLYFVPRPLSVVPMELGGGSNRLAKDTGSDQCGWAAIPPSRGPGGVFSDADRRHSPLEGG